MKKKKNLELEPGLLKQASSREKIHESKLHDSKPHESKPHETKHEGKGHDSAPGSPSDSRRTKNESKDAEKSEKKAGKKVVTTPEPKGSPVPTRRGSSPTPLDIDRKRSPTTERAEKERDKAPRSRSPEKIKHKSKETPTLLLSHSAALIPLPPIPNLDTKIVEAVRANDEKSLSSAPQKSPPSNPDERPSRIDETLTTAP